MPREMFAGSIDPRPARPRSRWTLLGSLVTHLLVVIAVVVLPLTAAVENPIVPRNVIEFIPAAPPPPAPAAPPVRPRDVTPPVNPLAAPPTAGTSLADERDLPPAIGSDGPPFAGWPVTSGRPLEGMPGRSVTTLAAPPPRVQPVPVGGHIREPRRLTYVPPVYPTIAQTAKVEGMVILEATIDETGAVRDVRVLRSIPLLDRAAVDAVSRWRYLPTTLNGVAVPVIMTVTVRFTLR